ncbi:MAG: hypothetical protein AUJ31_00400 [Parcubacteria group bacterium CG1_02_39_15]|uniref:GH10 domain-containing protein n=1 Tax=Candidatus Nealsonbacteria bacterium CG11_big_fil_rev_8_21_14_0_20_39_9 TaxID=1974715 RepID=A0A2H0MR62_9BACT|nr:MAG: hypothetical protein AUJ31_00400 [Parcubacteria group bacterium CG1_02_39_15]PIQ98334.1 MAG: hypothetical protein COV64_01825 [Candidatus Nealsonbacteria bacterium CG11_big_fil_rev_8_21_14_0_20_39_9]
MTKRIVLAAVIFFLFFVGCFFVGSPPQAKDIEWGVNFSQKQIELLGLNWQETYLALLEDLKVKKIKLITHWDLLEPIKEQYNFEDLDWQVKEAEKSGAEILLVIGMKTGRWPECHIPSWAKNLSQEKQQEIVLNLVKRIILRYRGSETIWAWQVENEPFFPFGECPWVDKNFLKEEIGLVKTLDLQLRPVVVSDSGEGSFWIAAARFGDIIGTTMYKKVWFRQLGAYIYYPLPPVFYWRKAQLIEKIFDKKVIVGELQAEPWGPKLLDESPLEEQEKTMNKDRFKSNIEFAKKTGLDEFYLWGGEWWYWLKTKQNQPEIWQEAQKLFVKSAK